MAPPNTRTFLVDLMTFDPNASNAGAGEFAADPTGTLAELVTVLGAPGARFSSVVVVQPELTVSNAAGGVLTRTITILVEDGGGNPIREAVMTVCIRATANVASVSDGGAGDVLSSMIVATDAWVMARTDVTGQVVLTVVAAGAADGVANVLVAWPGPMFDETAWTF